MKKLELNQMENLNGGEFRVECALDAAGMGIGIASGNIILLGFSAWSFFSSDCHND